MERFLERHLLPYRIDREPLKLTPLLHGEVDDLYRVLRARATADEKLKEALSVFESAWERHSTDWSQINAKDVIRTASLFAESALVSASNGSGNDFTRALSRMRTETIFRAMILLISSTELTHLQTITQISAISGTRVVSAGNFEKRTHS